MSTNVQTVSQSARPVTTPKIDGSEAQGSLPVGPTGQVHRGGGVPWHKRLALTKAPSPTAHHVLLVLGSFVSDGQSEAWPSVVTLASMTGLTRRTVQRALRALEDDRLVQTETVSGRPSRYRLASTCVTVTPYPRHSYAPPASQLRPKYSMKVPVQEKQQRCLSKILDLVSRNGTPAQDAIVAGQRRKARRATSAARRYDRVGYSVNTATGCRLITITRAKRRRRQKIRRFVLIPAGRER